MKIRENCYMLGLGSTGGKIYKEFVQRHYKGAAANGSEQDHKALGDVPNKYILQGFDGFGGHRERAMDCLAGNEDFIKFVEGIKEDIVFILFAGGGSTGSGCAPIVAEMLLEEKDEEGNPVKTVCPVIALPASGESLAKHKNAYETVQELQEIEGLGATFFLNNDSNENYDYINKNFASMLDEFLSNESYGRQNNFDESERLEMLKDSGAMVLSVTGDGTDSKIKLEKLTKSGIFAPIEDNYICENIGIIHSKNDKSDIDSEDVIAEVGKPDNVFEGFNGRKTIIAASGLDYPVSHVKKLGELAVKAKHNKELEYEKRRKVVDLINIYEGKFNKIGMKIGKTNPLSKNWYESKRKSNLFMLEQLKANTENFFRTVSKTNSEDNMYTVFKSYTKYIKGKGYSKGFVPCNARGTNEFKDKKALAYLVNFFMSPEIRQFVNHYDLIFDEDMCSLSALLQWMWRSQIRNGKPIDIYIPSERMRELLNNWIQNCYVTEKAA